MQILLEKRIKKNSQNLNKNLIQNKFKTPDYERYNLYDYSYTSSNSSYSKLIGKNIFLMWMIISKMMERFQKK